MAFNKEKLLIYERMINKIDDGIILLDANGKVKSVNQAFCLASGYEQSEILQNDIDSVFYVENGLSNLISQFFIGKQKWQGIALITKKDKTVSPIHLKLEKLYNDCVIAIFSNESQNKQTKQEQYLYSRVFESVSEAVMITDTHSTIISVNEAFKNITGYEKHEVTGKPASILSSGRHDMYFFIQMWAAIHDQGYWHGEIINKKKNGDIYLEKLSITPVRDEQGNIINYVGVFTDITETKKNASDLRMYSRVFENSNEGVMITDTKGVIVSVNPAFSKTTGFSVDEAVGKRPDILHSGRQDKAFYIRMWASIHDHGSWQGEVWNKRKNGEIYPEWLSINAIQDEHGEIINYVGIFTDITQQKESEAQLKHLAHFDSLTGLPNRLKFEAKLEELTADAELGNFMSAVLFLDLNRFKLVNDTYGHLAGDQLLIMVAERLKEVIGSSDLIFRLAGDEFTILLPEIYNREEVEEIVKEILKKVKAPFHLMNQELITECSIGVSIYPSDGGNTNTLLKSADYAMYWAKATGKGYQFFTQNMNQSSSRNMEMMNMLYKALERDEFTMYYQPQVDIQNGKIIGLESLIRWNSKELGFVSPAEFMPLAEETGLIISIGEWVMKTVCQQIKKWEKQGFFPPKVAIHLSARQFTSDSLVTFLSNTIHDEKIKPENIEIEITESVSMHDYSFVISTLRNLKKLGIHISVDDFGTGYSSLKYLKRFPVNTIKIDQSFVRNVVEDPENASIVKAIINMAKGLGLNVIAEGVETEEELKFLADHECHYVQGYLYAKPMPSHEIEYFLRKGKFSSFHS